MFASSHYSIADPLQTWAKSDKCILISSYKHKRPYNYYIQDELHL